MSIVGSDYYWLLCPPRNSIILCTCPVLLCCTAARVGFEPKTESRFFRSVFLGFSRPKTDFLKSFFRLPKKTETEKPTRFFSVVFFSAVPYANNALHICIEAPSYRYSPLAPGARRYQHAEEQHGGTGITFFYIVLPGTGIDIIMASYPPRGLYRI